MPPALEENTRDRVRELWFSGESRKNIAVECRIGAGSVTNIINELRNGLEESDLECIRELAVHLKKEGTTLAEFIRRHNFIRN